MSGSISLAGKLAVAGAFCALAAMAVGTEDDPGLIAESQDAVATAPKVHGQPPDDQDAPWWSAQGDTSGAIAAPPASQRSAAPEENLPPGFGATPAKPLK